ncbi:MAG: tetratricopeptide repeat protein [Candidatus Aminicenantes bacterium]|nr:MAG: tetratricopeptide repeat protein [Candidatus Aminicenantes bacterium]
MKRKKRRHLKEDEFASFVNKIVHYVRDHTQELMTLCFLVIILVVVFFGVRFISKQSQRKEGQKLTQILALQADLTNKPENLAKLEELAGRGRFTRLGYIYLSSYWIENGDLEKAQIYLEKIPNKPKDIVFYQAQDLLGQIHFKRKDYDRAIEIYRAIEEDDPESYSLDVVLFHRAEIHEEKGETDEALALYRKIQQEYSQTYYGFDASQKVTQLESKK